MSDEQTQEAPDVVGQVITTMADVGEVVAAIAGPNAAFTAEITAATLLLRAVNEIKKVGRGLSPEMESVLADAQKYLGL
ncbi:hypothetical protein QZM15_16280 [Burkholderia sp. AU44665]|uniref:hypothetical protein n=1 Tax=Burkholderia sp. AU44665 TaxID=3059203 RepID=UPI00265D7083|nr:hypothetical protein [Burkholderia sp. AU44665]MDN7700028.1 hypothetical protein [Burkholderia sp. AU44665]